MNDLIYLRKQIKELKEKEQRRQNLVTNNNIFFYATGFTDCCNEILFIIDQMEERKHE